jgi:hypothetical protein
MSVLLFLMILFLWVAFAAAFIAAIVCVVKLVRWRTPLP